jgi:hypothetical protein
MLGLVTQLFAAVGLSGVEGGGVHAAQLPAVTAMSSSLCRAPLIQEKSLGESLSMGGVSRSILVAPDATRQPIENTPQGLTASKPIKVGRWERI